MNPAVEERIVVTTGDITECRVEAIVNAANSTLLGGGGVDGAIHRKGGAAVLAACKEIRRTRYPDGLPIGEAVITTAGNLPARWVIHTVGPVWRGGTSGEALALANAYRNSLARAAEAGASTIAFPAISTGVYRFPKERAAPIAHAAIAEFLGLHDLPREVRLVFYSDDDKDIFLSFASRYS